MAVKYLIKSMVVLIFAISFSSLSNANTSPHGWRWYDDPNKNKIKKKPKPPQRNTVTRTLSATEQMEWFQGVHKEVTTAATIDPENNEKTERMMRFNQYVSNQSGKLGMTFKEVLLDNPDLSYIKDRPVTSCPWHVFTTRKRKENASREAND